MLGIHRPVKPMNDVGWKRSDPASPFCLRGDDLLTIPTHTRLNMAITEGLQR